MCPMSRVDSGRGYLAGLLLAALSLNIGPCLSAVPATFLHGVASGVYMHMIHFGNLSRPSTPKRFRVEQSIDSMIRYLTSFSHNRRYEIALLKCGPRGLGLATPYKYAYTQDLIQWLRS